MPLLRILLLCLFIYVVYTVVKSAMRRNGKTVGPEQVGESMVLDLTPEAFLGRYLAHLPQPGAQTVRGYGLYGQRSGARLDRARAALGQPPAIEPTPLAVEDFLARFDRTPAAATCAQCGARLRFVPLIAHGPAPPPLH